MKDYRRFTPQHTLVWLWHILLILVTFNNPSTFETFLKNLLQYEIYVRITFSSSNRKYGPRDLANCIAGQRHDVVSSTDVDKKTYLFGGNGLDSTDLANNALARTSSPCHTITYHTIPYHASSRLARTNDKKIKYKKLPSTNKILNQYDDILLGIYGP